MGNPRGVYCSSVFVHFTSFSVYCQSIYAIVPLKTILIRPLQLKEFQKGMVLVIGSRNEDEKIM